MIDYRLKQPHRHRFPVAQYAMLERTDNQRYEYYGEKLFTVPDKNFRQVEIAGNLFGALWSNEALRGRGYKPYNCQTKIETVPGCVYLYPDLCVIHGAPVMSEQVGNAVCNPVVVFEVLDFDLANSAKAENHRHRLLAKMPSLLEHVTVHSGRPEIVVSKRDNPGGDGGLRIYSTTTTTGLSSNLRLKSLDVEIPLKVIYQNLAFINEA